MERTMERRVYFDNIKGTLMLLVVIGHIMGLMKANFDILKQLYTFIYIFHMPMFIVVSGYFSGTGKGLKAINKHVVRIILPYLIFQTLFTIVSFAYPPPTMRLLIGSFVVPKFVPLLIAPLIVPKSVLWYLWCLFAWRIILPYFVQVPYPIALSFLIGVLSGFLTNYGFVLSISRMLTFFPYFVVGYYMKETNVFDSFLKTPGKFKKLSICILLLTFIGSFFMHGGRYDVWLQGKKFYAEMGHLEWYSMVFRLVTYVAGFIVGFSFLSLVPRNTSPVTVVGKRSLYVYLLHGLLLYWVLKTSFNCPNFWLTEINDPTYAMLIVLSGMPLSLLLSSYTIRSLTRVLVEPRTLLRFRNESR